MIYSVKRLFYLIFGENKFYITYYRNARDEDVSVPWSDSAFWWYTLIKNQTVHGIYKMCQATRSSIAPGSGFIPTHLCDARTD